MNRPGPGDSELVGRCLEGDSSAWETLVQRYRRLVYSVPVRMGFPAEEADEVFQETFVTLLDKLATLKERERIGLWLAVIARRKALDRVKRPAAKREVALSEEVDPEDQAPLAVDELVVLEQRDRVQTALGRLAERCRKLIQALYYEDPPVPYRTLARALQVPEGSLGPTRKRCFDKLRRELEAAGGDVSDAVPASSLGRRGQA